MFVLILLAFFFVGMSLNMFSQLLSSHTRETVQLKRRIEGNSLPHQTSGVYTHTFLDYPLFLNLEKVNEFVSMAIEEQRNTQRVKIDVV